MTSTIVRKREQHGKRHTPEYNTWCHMKARCHNKSNARYIDYGGRGIEVCPEWRESFIAFYNDIGEKPSPAHSIDRINNDKGYSKDNCKWSTDTEQAQNRRIRSDNVSGVTGVVWREDIQKYRARITKDGKRITLGNYKTIESAVEARQNAEAQYYQQVKVN